MPLPKPGEIEMDDRTNYPPQPELQEHDFTVPEITPEQTANKRAVIKSILEDPDTNPWNPFEKKRKNELPN